MDREQSTLYSRGRLETGRFRGVEAAIKALDHRGTKLGTYKLKNRQASDIAELMSEVFESMQAGIFTQGRTCAG